MTITKSKLWPGFGLFLVLLIVACLYKRGQEGTLTFSYAKISFPANTIDNPMQLPEPDRSRNPKVRVGNVGEANSAPESFDVVNDGTIVLADTLGDRLLLLGMNGTVQGVISLPFTPDMVISRHATKSFLVRDRLLRKVFEVSESGRVGASRESPPDYPTQENDFDARISGTCSAIIKLRAEDGRFIKEETFDLCVPPNSLVTVRSIVTHKNRTFLDAEVAKDGDVNQSIRSVLVFDLLSHKLLATVQTGSEFFTFPNDSVRVANGVIYQLVPQEKEVLIKKWQPN